LLGNVFLMWVAIGILALQVVFALTALPLELNASGRAIALLEEGVIALSERRASAGSSARRPSPTWPRWRCAWQASYSGSGPGGADRPADPF
jgi:hypothetical protein